jgi:hypothetical protein
MTMVTRSDSPFLKCCCLEAVVETYLQWYQLAIGAIGWPRQGWMSLAAPSYDAVMGRISTALPQASAFRATVSRFAS